MRYCRIISAIVALILLCTGASASEAELADVYFSCENGGKKIALTFDDGPHYKYTPEILDILKEENVKATFFVVGQLAERYPELILREISEGHEVASHTWSHPHLTEISKDTLISELSDTEELIFELAEYRTRLFRPPEGKYSDTVRAAAAELDYEVVLWTVDTRDWAHPTTDKIVETVLSGTKSGSIILCHDFIGHDSPTPEAIRRFIPELKRNGYEFVTVSELILGD